MRRAQTIAMGMLLGGALVASGGQTFLTSASAISRTGVGPGIAPALMRDVAAGEVNARGWTANHHEDKHHDRDERGKGRSDKDEDRNDDDRKGKQKGLDQRVINDIKQLLG